MRSLFLFTALLSVQLSAATVSYMGQTWAFEEPDMLSEIYATINDNKAQIEKKIKKEVAREKHELENLSVKNPINLPRATKNLIYRIDLTYTVENDIYDGEGKILYPKGYRFDPANYVNMAKSLVIIDSSDPEQLKWLKRENLANNIYFKILVCKGGLMSLIKELKQPVFQYTEEMQKRLKLNHTPTIVTQERNQIIAHEICMKCSTPNKEANKKNTMKTLSTSKK